MRKSWNVVDYDWTQHPNPVDYSEKVTEPGLVLSMRDIYQRYAAQGIDLLSGEFVQDDEDPDNTEFLDADDDLDVLQHASSIRMRQASAVRSAKRTKKASSEAEEQTKKPGEEEEHRDDDKPGE